MRIYKLGLGYLLFKFLTNQPVHWLLCGCLLNVYYVCASLSQQEDKIQLHVSTWFLPSWCGPVRRNRDVHIRQWINRARKDVIILSANLTGTGPGVWGVQGTDRENWELGRWGVVRGGGAWSLLARRSRIIGDNSDREGLPGWGIPWACHWTAYRLLCLGRNIERMLVGLEGYCWVVEITWVVRDRCSCRFWLGGFVNLAKSYTCSNFYIFFLYLSLPHRSFWEQ